LRACLFFPTRLLWDADRAPSWVMFEFDGNYTDLLFIPGGVPKPKEPDPPVPQRVIDDLIRALIEKDPQLYREAYRRAHRKEADLHEDDAGYRDEDSSLEVNFKIAVELQPTVDLDPAACKEFLQHVFVEPQEPFCYASLQMKSDLEEWQDKCVYPIPIYGGLVQQVEFLSEIWDPKDSEDWVTDGYKNLVMFQDVEFRAAKHTESEVLFKSSEAEVGPTETLGAGIWPMDDEIPGGTFSALGLAALPGAPSLGEEGEPDFGLWQMPPPTKAAEPVAEVAVVEERLDIPPAGIWPDDD